MRPVRRFTETLIKSYRPCFAVFVLVVAFMIPPYHPVIQSLEVFANMYFFCALAWAWVSFSLLLSVCG